MSNDKYLAPPWIKYPFAPKESTYWKDGSGAEYLIKFNNYIKDCDDYDEMFPKIITFEDDVELSDDVSDNFKMYMKSPQKPLFIKSWSSSGKPKYDPEYVEGEYSIMYDSIFTEEKHIPLGNKHYHSINEIITLAKDSLNDLDLSSSEREELWEEIKYTVYLNSLYYRLILDINLINEIMKMDGIIIACYSDNLEYGIQKTDDGRLLGKNLMGLAMMELRDELIKAYKNYENIDWDESGKPYSVKKCHCMLHNH